MSVLDRIVVAVTPPESEEDRAKARQKARAAAAPGDWLDQILQHHEQIEACFTEAHAAADAPSRTRAQRKLAALLTSHSSAEEAVIYPQLSHDHKTHTPLAKDAALVDAGVNWAVSTGVSLGLAYSGALADHSQAHSARAMLALRF